MKLFRDGYLVFSLTTRRTVFAKTLAEAEGLAKGIGNAAIYKAIKLYERKVIE